MTVPRPSFHCTVQRDPRHGPADLSVLQFNVLARGLERETADDRSIAGRVMRFEHRKGLNLEHILNLQPTLCVLEEVDDLDEFYGPALRAAGYDVVADRKSGGARDYTCVFFRAADLELRRHRVDRLGDGQSQFAVLCHFRSRRSRVDFVVIAQHAKAGRTEENETIRFTHAHRIVTESLPSFVHGDTAAIGKRIVWAGDFNASPHSYGGRYPARVVPWLLGEERDPSHPGCPIAFRSAVKDATGAHPLFTTCKRRDGAMIVQTIDYVLFADGAARCVGHLPCPSADPERELAPLYLPNERWGSDHLSVYCELRWL